MFPYSKRIILLTLKSNTLKLSPILAQYLYTTKHLSLSGIGTFKLDNTFDIEPDVARTQRTGPPGNVKFESISPAKDDLELIAFISSQTGKMKSLAAADLDSHLELARQFLNIGKPFLFEGIGTLVKNRQGRFDFTPGAQLNERIKDSTEGDPTSTTEESFTQFSDMFSPKKPVGPSARKLTVLLAIIAGLVLAVWGGYTIYKKGEALKKNRQEELQVSLPITDTVSRNEQPSQQIATTNPQGTYRFVIEQSSRQRALKRYRDLRDWGVQVNMETKDSLSFKLLFVLEATPADTLKIRDSLSRLYVNPYYMKGGKARIE